jgi:hypothetical protein
MRGRQPIDRKCPNADSVQCRTTVGAGSRGICATERNVRAVSRMGFSRVRNAVFDAVPAWDPHANGSRRARARIHQIR